MNLPNKLTMSRISIIPIFLIFLIPLPEWTNRISIIKVFNEFVAHYGDIVAATLFCIASITDGIDGYVARKYNLVTNLGIFLDPIADKLLVASALIALAQKNRIGIWVTIIVIGREFVITGFRLIASDNKIVISANNWGKIKTISQMILILIAILSTYINAIFDINAIVNILAFIVIIATVYSGWTYIYSNKHILKNAN